jgi:hypothetical protein
MGVFLISFTSAWSNNTLIIDECYQETANVSTACGGLATGTYSSTANYLYINYTKPTGATNLSLWKVKHGVNQNYTVSIPNSCWNYNANKLIFRFYSIIDATSTSYGQCYNGSWVTITPISTETGTSGFSVGGGITLAYDGNWDTKTAYTSSIFNTWGFAPNPLPDVAPYAEIYEEAMFWRGNSYTALTNENLTFNGGNNFTRYLQVPSSVSALTSGYLNLSGYNDTTITYPTNTSLTIGNTGVWNYTETFNQTNNKTSNLATTINKYLNSTYLVGSFYMIPFIFSSATAGILQYSDMLFNNEGFIENSQTYSATTYETANEVFVLNFTADSPISTVAILNYNGTAYTGTSTCIGNNCIATKTLVIPLLPGGATQNKSFYWTIIIYEGTNSYVQNSSTFSQTILGISALTGGTTCAAGTSSAFNFSFADETNLTALNNVTVNYNIKYGLSGNTTGQTINGSLVNIASFSICINNSAPNYTIGYGEVQYSLTGYADRRFYIFENTRASNKTITNVLYLLQSASATSFLVTAQDNYLNNYENNYLTLLRWYPSVNQYKVVEMARTDEKGQTIFRVKTEDVDYRIGLYEQDGTLIKLIDPIRMICTVTPCTYNLFVSGTGGTYTDVNNIAYDLSYNNNTQIVTFTWNDPSQATSSMNLIVKKLTGTGSTIICNSTTASFTGVITCDLTTQNGQITAYVVRTASPGVRIAFLNIDKFLTRIIDSANGKTLALFGMMILIMLVALIGIFSPVFSIVLSIFALIPMYFIGGVTLTVIGAVVVMGAVIIHFIKTT